MNNPFDPKNKAALRELSLADGWQRYVIIGRTESGVILEPVLTDADESTITIT